MLERLAPIFLSASLVNLTGRDCSSASYGDDAWVYIALRARHLLTVRSAVDC